MTFWDFSNNHPYIGGVMFVVMAILFFIVLLNIEGWHIRRTQFRIVRMQHHENMAKLGNAPSPEVEEEDETEEVDEESEDEEEDQDDSDEDPLPNRGRDKT